MLCDCINKILTYFKQTFYNINIPITVKHAFYVGLQTGMPLKNVKTVHARIEDYAKDNREKYDIVTCRAVSNLRVLLEICIPLVKIDGFFIPMKGVIETELDEAHDMFKKLDCTLINTIDFELPIENSKRSLLKIKKNKETNHKYPRRYDVIKKEA